MVFKPLAFKYLHEMHLPSAPFTTFGVPTSLNISKPGFYSPTQGRLWKVTREHAIKLYSSTVPAAADKLAPDRYGYVIIEVWNDRSSTWHVLQYELMGYALIYEADLPQVVVDGVLVGNICTAFITG